MVQSAADNEDDDDDEEDEEDSPAKPSITRGSKKGAKAAAAVSISILRTVLTCSTLIGTHQTRWCCATVASLFNELCEHRSVRWGRFSCPGPSMICHCHIIMMYAGIVGCLRILRHKRQNADSLIQSVPLMQRGGADAKETPPDCKQQ